MKVLMPIDGSDQSLWTIKATSLFIDKQTSEIYLFLVITPQTAIQPWGFYLSEQEAAAKTTLAQAEQVAAAAGLKVSHAEYRTFPEPATAICHYAKEMHIDLILIGSHGYQGLQKLLLGSVSEQVFKQAEQPVLVVRNDKAHTLEVSHYDLVTVKPIS